MRHDQMADDPSTHEVQVQRLDELARYSLPLWGIDAEAPCRLINLSENATYLVEPADAPKVVLRLHREGYHSKQAIASELAWMDAIERDTGVITPTAIPGLDGERIQHGHSAHLPAERYMVLFEFIEGREPDETEDDLTVPFQQLGEVSARLHEHAMRWPRPRQFERLTWDDAHILGPTPNWGDWRAAPAMDEAARGVLERQEVTIRRRLAAFGRDPQHYNLVHADIRLANLLVHDGNTRVIDFDDCGMGWFLYDVATTVSFIEDHPKVPEWIDAWLEGYHRVRQLSPEERAEIPTFVMLRRMALLAWIGSHAETDLAKEQGPDFTRVSVELAEDYLAKFG